jgi:release factor glutamine methyltransferase
MPARREAVRVGHHPETFREALLRATEALRKEGKATPRLDADLLLAHTLRLSRTRLYAQLDRQLSATRQETFQRLLERRLAGAPVAHLLATKEFYGLTLQVGPGALIPRPETEILVERALSILEEWEGEGSIRVADVGTGSGCIAIALAANSPAVHVWATEISPEAVEIARLNLQSHGLEDRVDLLEGNLLTPVPKPVRLIVANLPYVRRPDLDDLQAEIRDHEPRVALDGGPDGTDVIARLLAHAPAWLAPDGAVLLEIGALQGEATLQLARFHFPRARTSIIPDYAGLDRVVKIRCTGD